MAISDEKKAQVAKLLDNLNLGTKREALGQVIIALIEETSGGGATAWADITGKPAVIAAGADQASARTAIGAGTSNLALGTTAATALAGNGTAAAATKLATARTITLTGAVTGSASFDGSGNITIATTSA